MDVYGIYASTSGNVETVMEHTAQVLAQYGHTLHLLRAEKTSPEVIQSQQFFILATSTWEHGKINPFFIPLLKYIQQQDLHGKQAAFVGLGDRRYEPLLFCQGMETLREAWLKQGGRELGQPLRIEGEPYEQLETGVTPWVQECISFLPHA